MILLPTPGRGELTDGTASLANLAGLGSMSSAVRHFFGEILTAVACKVGHVSMILLPTMGRLELTASLANLAVLVPCSMSSAVRHFFGEILCGCM